MNLPEIIPTDLLKEIYADLARPGVQNVGKAIGSVLGLGNTILLPLHLLNEKASITAKRNLDKYREKLENLESDNITEVAPEIAVPIIEKLIYVTDEEISNLYINLLTSASTKNFEGCAHPSFIGIINQLTPDEAHIIKYLSQNSVIGYHSVKSATGKKSYERLQKTTAFPKELSLAFPEKSTLYCRNLYSLGVLEDQKRPLANKLHYRYVKPISEHMIELWKEERPDATYTIIEGAYRLTDLGVEFVIACGHSSPEIVSHLKRFSPEAIYKELG